MARKRLGFRSERGVSAVEALLFLTVFLAVGSAFGGVVLTTGLTSSERLDRTLNDALARSDAGLELRGPVIATTDGARVIAVSLDVALSSSYGEVPLIPEPAGERIVVSYVDAGNNVNALPYSVAWVTGDGDNLLEAGEMAEIAINVGGLDPALAGGGSFHIEVRPPRGSHLVIRRNVPPGNALDRVINLN